MDGGSGITRKAEMTPARVHDSRVFDPLFSGDERAVYAEQAYNDTARREPLQKRGINDGILKKGRRKRPLTDWERTWNRSLSAIHSPVERVFGTLKRSYGFPRARYIGLIRNRNHAYLLAMAFNMRKMTRLLPAS